MFEAIQVVFDPNAQYLNGDASQHDKVRKLMVQMVNAMSAKMEMGGPMACMYLLGHEDHYTSHSFKTFFWKGYVNQVRNTWEKEDAMDIDNEDHVILNNVKGNVVGLSPVLHPHQTRYVSAVNGY